MQMKDDGVFYSSLRRHVSPDNVNEKNVLAKLTVLILLCSNHLHVAGF